MQEYGCDLPRAKGYNAGDRRLGVECFLSQIKEIDRSIRRKQNKIARHRDALSLSGVRYSDMPKAPSSPPSSMEEHFCEIGQLEWEIAEDLKERSYTQAEMLIRLAEMGNSRCFIVLKGLYVDRKRWKAVRCELGCSDKGIKAAKEEGMEILTDILERREELALWIRKAKE